MPPGLLLLRIDRTMRNLKRTSPGKPVWPEAVRVLGIFWGGI